MEQSYSAELINNQINWLGEKPKRLYKNRKYRVQVIIENKVGSKQSGKALADFFRNSPLFGVELDLNRK